ncbi:MAG: PEP-CTERM sorting domain-containing protein [Pseudomonadota bacterium]
MSIGNSKKLATCAAAAILSMFAALPAKAGFVGNTVHADYLFPDIGNAFTNLGDAVIGSGPEFAVTYVSTLTADISDTSILINIFNGDALFSPSPFNGFHFFDTLGTISPITNVSIASINRFDFNASDITFDADNIFLNFEGLIVVPDSSLLLNVSFVPEPVSALLFGLGLTVIGLGWRKA